MLDIIPVSWAAGKELSCVDGHILLYKKLYLKSSIIPLYNIALFEGTVICSGAIVDIFSSIMHMFTQKFVTVGWMCDEFG